MTRKNILDYDPMTHGLELDPDGIAVLKEMFQEFMAKIHRIALMASAFG